MTRAQFLSGSQELSPGAAFDIKPRGGRAIVVTAGSAGIDGKMPDARTFQEGGPIAYILNVGSNSFDVVDQSDAVIVTLAANEAATMLLFDNSTADGDWDAIESSVLS
jgi:hypothetical protein